MSLQPAGRPVFQTKAYCMLPIPAPGVLSPLTELIHTTYMHTVAISVQTHGTLHDDGEVDSFLAAVRNTCPIVVK